MSAKSYYVMGEVSAIIDYNFRSPGQKSDDYIGNHPTKCPTRRISLLIVGKFYCMLDRYTINTDDGTMVVNSYVEPSELSLAEASVWALKDIVLNCIGGTPDNMIRYVLPRILNLKINIL